MTIELLMFQYLPGYYWIGRFVDSKTVEIYTDGAPLITALEQLDIIEEVLTKGGQVLSIGTIAMRKENRDYLN